MTTTDSHLSNMIEWGIFKDSGMVLIRKGSGTISKPIFMVSGLAADWDGVDTGTATYSEQMDTFGYIQIKVTGRKLRYGSWGGKSGSLITVQVKHRDGDEWSDAERAEVFVPWGLLDGGANEIELADDILGCDFF